MRGAAIALAALALAACASVQPAVQAVRKPPPAPKTQMAALETHIYQLVEQAREKLDPKATPLARNAELDAVARAHSLDMAKRHYLAHRSPDGETAASIIMARDPKFQGVLGENIAAEYFTKEGGVDPKVYAKRFLATWLGSKAHRDNIVFPDYSRTGVGAAVSGDTVYVTQLFAADLDAVPKNGKPAKPGKTGPAQNAAPGRNVRLRGSKTADKLSDETP